ncbi:glutamine-hydrolyzing GMP synthase [Actinobaculum sp. 352]|uniref:glutamine-hydrolyzing GMP synthase n=1 Tax=Actinobaculum sp. 352 TaxID=2490946 RepID=UPI001F49D2D8|nr:glutamine-hydrolyzing GMP synthase [Actinobaculum sp. 352]
MHPVLVVDFGAQYSQLIARRVREAHVYSEIVPHSMSAQEMLAKNPAAIILSGGPSSVYAEGAPSLDPQVFDAGIPILGICYGFQVMAQALGGSVGRTGTREYGHTEAMTDPDSILFAGTPPQQTVWMSHGDAVHDAPEGFTVTATTSQTSVAAFEDKARQLFGLQWHPEVQHSEFGQRALENFLYEGAGLKATWTPGSIVDEQVAAIRAQVGGAQVICALSGGVDSSVAAALVHRAVGDQLTCFFIDHGLLRAGEREQVEQDYAADMGIRVITVDESERFLDALLGVTEPEEKRKIIGREFIRSFEAAQRMLVEQIEAGQIGSGAESGKGPQGGAGGPGDEDTEGSASRPDGKDMQGSVAATGGKDPQGGVGGPGGKDPQRGAGVPGVRFLVQGTLYPDVVESGGGEGAANIKSHHNVGGLPEDMTFELVEPLRTLFKDEVRAIGRELGVPEKIVARQPFPGPGLGIRIIGEVTRERLEILRAADLIVREELTAAGLDEEIWQCPVVLLADVQSVGVQGDQRTYGHPIVLRPVSSEDAMTADWARVPYDVVARISNRITNSVPEINRVVLDCTSKPPGTIEWE